MFRSLRFVLAGVLLVASFGFVAPHAMAVDDLNTQYSKISAPIGTPTQGIIFAGICGNDLPPTDGSADKCVCRGTGNCTLTDVLQLFVNLSTFILGISGTAVLFVFVYGGFKWIFARGEQKHVSAGTDAMTAGVIGLCIIFGAYVAINFIIAGLKTNPGDTITPQNIELNIDKSNTPATASKAKDVLTTQ